MKLVESPRPRPRWTDAATLLRNFALVTFDVEPGALAAVLPPSLVPDLRRLDDGRDRGFVSAVSFRDVDFRFRGAEAVRVSFNQTNYRAYVLGPDGRPSAYFFETTLDSGLGAIPRRLWGMPWYDGRTTIRASWTADLCETYEHRCTGERNAVDAAFEGTAERAGRLDGFTDAGDAANVLTHPLDGWYSRPDGRVGHYSVWHPRLQPTLGSAVRARYQVFERLGLVGADTRPHSVLLQPSVEFDVHLPPSS